MGSARDDTAVRSTLGSYRLFGEVGRDPLGGSYLACPAGVQTFPKWAVVRRLHSGVARDPVMVHAFLAATQAAVRMVHPNVASTFDFGGKMTLPWAAREHMLGVAVLDLIARLVDKKTKVPWALASYLVAQAADGVAAVRSRLPAHGPPIGFLTGAVAPSVFVTGGGRSRSSTVVSRSSTVCRSSTRARSPTGLASQWPRGSTPGGLTPSVSA
jgi:hypothetical protein